MDWFIYIFAWMLIKGLQSLPLPLVARIGRFLGALAYVLDGRHRKVALANLTMVFGSEKSGQEIRELARENFKRIGENYCSAVKTTAMSADKLKPHLEFANVEHLYPEPFPKYAPPRVVAIGHFGNFELYPRFGQFFQGIQCASTYRALRPPSLNKLLLQMRASSDSLLFERRTEAAALKAAMSKPGILLGLLVDQHAGSGGVWVPFFGRECSTSSAPAVFALRYNCRLFTAFCYRIGLAKWRIEAGPEIPLRDNGEARAIKDITRDINIEFEKAVRRDPANWFWVHKRWKPKHQPAPRELAHV